MVVLGTKFIFLKKNAKLFGQFKKKLYLCGDFGYKYINDTNHN